MYSGNEYLIVGMGGIGIDDLDIELYNRSGDLVDRDTSTDNIPTVSVFPRGTAMHKINVDLYSLAHGYDQDGEYLLPDTL